MKRAGESEHAQIHANDGNAWEGQFPFMWSILCDEYRSQSGEQQTKPDEEEELPWPLVKRLVANFFTARNDYNLRE